MMVESVEWYDALHAGLQHPTQAARHMCHVKPGYLHLPHLANNSTMLSAWEKMMVVASGACLIVQKQHELSIAHFFKILPT